MHLQTVLRLLIIIVFSLTLSSACSSAPLQPDAIKLPPGFSITVYAAKVPGARSLALGAQGTPLCQQP